MTASWKITCIYVASGAAFYHNLHAEGQPGDINWKSSPEEEVINLVSFSSLVFLLLWLWGSREPTLLCSTVGIDWWQTCYRHAELYFSHNWSVKMLQRAMSSQIWQNCHGMCFNWFEFSPFWVRLPPLVSPSRVNAVLQTWFRCHLSVCPWLSLCFTSAVSLSQSMGSRV